MNKIVNINLGGMPFQIDENAYDMLMHYLTSIQQHFANTADQQEIIDDIEKRLAEILTEKLKNGKQIISLQDVEEIMAIMGKPEEMGEAEESTNVNTQQQSNNNSSNHTKQEHWYQHRLYRNTEDKILGGVCSGLSGALGINPFWLRLIFAISILLFGTGFLLYIILWIIIPPAKSTTEKIEMQGEPINLNNIGKQIQQDAKAFKEHMKKWGEELKTTVKQYTDNAKTVYTKKPKRKNVFALALRAIGRFIVIICRILFLLILFAFILIVLRGLGWEALGNYPYELDKIFDNSTQAIIVLVSLCITIGISIAIGIIRLLKYIFQFKFNHKPLKYIQGVIISITLIILLVVAGIITHDFSVEGKVHTEIAINNNYNKLYIKLLHYNTDNEEETFLSDRTIRLNVEPSLDSNFHLDQYSYARSSKRFTAENIARKTIVPIVQHDSTIEIGNYFDWLPANKWRAQFVEFTLKIPKDKIAYIQEDVLYHTNISNSDIDDMMAFTGEYAQWTTKDNNLVCINKDTSESKRYGDLYPIDLQDIENVKVRGNFQLNMVYGNEPALYIISSNKDKFKIYAHNNKLYIIERSRHFGPLTIKGNYYTEKVTLVLPHLIENDIDDNVSVHIDSKLKSD